MYSQSIYVLPGYSREYIYSILPNILTCYIVLVRFFLSALNLIGHCDASAYCPVSAPPSRPVPAAAPSLCAIMPDADGAVQVPASWTTIPSDSFTDCDTLISINIPPSVVEIEDSAFYGCINLKQVLGMVNVGKIGESAFEECRSLATFKQLSQSPHNAIPTNVKEIKDLAFYRCEALSTMNVPSAVQFIGDYAFGGCISLEQVFGMENVEYIGEEAFSGCSNLRSIPLTAVTEVGQWASGEKQYNVLENTEWMHAPRAPLDEGVAYYISAHPRRHSSVTFSLC